jgi:hypothetical protein
MDLKSLARPLGWFSLVLGAAEMLAPRRISAAHGAAGAAPLVGAFGAREIAAGVGILAAPRSPAGFIARAAGDVLDVGAAGLAAARARGRARAIALGSLAFVTGAFVVDLMVARALARGRAR